MNVESRLEDALDAMTHAVMGGTSEAGLRRVARGFDRDQAEPFVPLLLNLRAAYEPVEPSAKFLRQLQEDLIGEPQRGLIGRARSMPPRVQFAAAAVAREGPDHAPSFTVEVTVQGFPPEAGQGRSRQDAEKAAAQVMLLKREGPAEAPVQESSP